MMIATLRVSENLAKAGKEALIRQLVRDLLVEQVVVGRSIRRAGYAGPKRDSGLHGACPLMICWIWSRFWLS